MKSRKKSLRNRISKKTKRLAFRLAVLSTVVGLGVYAIAQSRRGAPDSHLPEAEIQVATPDPVQPISIEQEQSSASGSPLVSPFAESRSNGRGDSAGSVYATQQAVSRQEAAFAPAPMPVSFHDSHVEPTTVGIPTFPSTPVEASPATPPASPMARPLGASPADLTRESTAAAPAPLLPVLGSSSNASLSQPADAPASVAPQPAVVAPLATSGAVAPVSERATNPPAQSIQPSPAPSVEPFNPGLTAPSSQPPPPEMPAAPPSQTINETQMQQPPPSSATARVATRDQGAGLPGAASQEGPQQAQLVLQKLAPQEVQVGQAATFETRIRNVGQTPAERVILQDQVPQGARLADTTPAAIQGSDGTILWELGTIEPGEEKLISMQLVPLTEGEIGSVATVAFQTSATARSIVTRPQLTITHSTVDTVLIGEQVVMRIVVANQGSGAARRVILEENVPHGLAHTGGSELEYEIGDLTPGESKELELVLTAGVAGRVTNTIRARAEGNLLAEDSIDIQIVAPQLTLNIAGPSRRYLDREATFEISVTNPGTAAAHNLELVAHLPRGLQFVNTNNAGQYHADQHAIYWSLEELPAGQAGQVLVTTLPIEMGQHRLQIDGRADLNLQAAQEHAIDVEGLAELIFEVADVADPIEIGSETEYEVRVVNQGSKVSTNVRLIAVLPPELQPLGGEGPTRAVIEGQQIIFEPLARLAPKADTLFRVRVAGGRPGDHRVRIMLASDDMAAVVKEEATRVYSDQ